MTTDNLREGGHKGPSFSRRTFAKAAGVSAAALAIGASGASLAWFTGRDAKENKLSIAQNLNIRVVEPAWDPENAKSVVPNQHIPKDPRIENLSDEFSGWMVVEIRVPTAVVSVFDETEQKVLDPARTPLFSFVADPKWTLLQQFEDGDEDVYRFGWPETIPALGQTPPIFEEVVVANLAEAQGQSGSKTITATGYGIQSEGLPDIATAWDAYKKQNGIGDGEPAEKTMINAVTAGATLYITKDEPSVGEEYNGEVVKDVVRDIEHLSSPATYSTPLTAYPSELLEVSCDAQVKPENIDRWFKDCNQIQALDLSKLDTSDIVKTADAVFDGTNELVYIKYGENTDIHQIVPDRLFQFEELSCYAMNGYGALQLENGDLVFVENTTTLHKGDMFENVAIKHSWWKWYENEEKLVYWAASDTPWQNPNKNRDFTEIKHVRFRDPLKVVSLEKWFDGLRAESIDLRNMDGTVCESMNNAFSWGSYSWPTLPPSLKRVDLTGLYLPNLKTMDECFANQYCLEGAIFENVDAPNLASMTSAFSKCLSLNELDFTNMNAPSLEDISNMCEGTESGTVYVEVYDEEGCSSYEPVGHGGVSKVSIGSNFGGDKLTKAKGAFKYCINLKEFGFEQISHWSHLNNLNEFLSYSGCVSLNLEPLSLTNVKWITQMCAGSPNLVVVSFGNWDGSTVSGAAKMFEGCSHLSEVDCKYFVVHEDPILAPGGYDLGFVSCPRIQKLSVPIEMRGRGIFHESGKWYVEGSSTKYDVWDISSDWKNLWVGKQYVTWLHDLDPMYL